MAGRLAGRTALVTGAGVGIGAAIARRFHEEGARVLVNDLHKDTAEQVAREVGGVALEADVADPDAVRRMFEQVASEAPELDVLVNNAGIGFERQADRERFDRIGVAQAEEIAAGGPVKTHHDYTVQLADEDWRRMMAVHLDGTFYCSREALKIMGPRMRGNIINMGSIMGTAGGAAAPHYCAAKAGILGLTRSLAREVVTRGIRVNAIAPGWIETAMTEGFPEAMKLIEAQTPMGRRGDVDDIAWAAVYLASDEAKFVTGQVLSPNGGWHMSQ